MRQIDLMFRTMVAELQQRSFDDDWAEDFPPTGRFVPVTVDGRCYWYFDHPNGEGGQMRRYVGPADDPMIAERVETFKGEKSDYKARRKFVSTLTREAGLIAADRFTGDVIQALAKAGLFRLRGILIGTVAFQCYSAYLGIRLPSAAILTGDADIAQDFAISAEVTDTLPPILDLLKGLDPTFRAVPHISGSSRSHAFRNQAGYRVEFLTTNRGAEEYSEIPANMPALGGASAEPLRFMDFLIRDPVRSILLHGAGVSVVIPDPCRYAVHKLIIAGRRQTDAGGQAKRDKDLTQAGLLFDALPLTGHGPALADALKEAWDRGPAWKLAISSAAETMHREYLGSVNRLVGILET
ncbi:GSU2403 family nucleotidyltransferase fold protein [Rhizobium sp. WL3]|uniref:nucleotidyltransferase family protein n=1 Tax=Rhizobium sp. WL3 TaxID=2603277 RepID=UPI001650C365|nr:GSU2403 family nucleotidyltransferase fold protein [Rhizobium sp. WL3]